MSKWDGVLLIVTETAARVSNEYLNACSLENKSPAPKVLPISKEVSSIENSTLWPVWLNVGIV